MSISILDGPLGWIYFAGFWLLLLTLAVLELLRPIHASPLQPNGRLITNFGMGLLNNATVALLPFSLLAAAGWAHQNAVGLVNLVPMPWAVGAAITIAARSLAAYWVHRASHRFGLLWRLHRVHHTDVAVDLSTGFRNHPLEALFVVGCLSALTVLLGFDPLALASYEALAIAFTLWSHANVRLPAPGAALLRKIFVIPDMHHIHHSAAQHETDSNYGEVFSFWDRLFGTYVGADSAALPAMQFGLADPHASHFGRQLWSPVRAARVENQQLETSPSASISRR